MAWVALKLYALRRRVVDVKWCSVHLVKESCDQKKPMLSAGRGPQLSGSNSWRAENIVDPS